MKKVEQSETTKSRSEIEERVAKFREQLELLNDAYQGLLKLGVSGDFYTGPNLAYTHLPDKVNFKKTTVERF